MIPPTPAVVLVEEQFASPAQTWTAAELASTQPPSPVTYAGSYWLNPYATERAGDTTGTLVGEGWLRATVSAPGFDTTFVYRNHQYAQSQVQTSSPYSGPGQGGRSPYPVPATFTLTSTSTLAGLPTLAANEDFAIWKTTIEILPPLCILGLCTSPLFLQVHPLLPDLIVDVRSLLPTAAGAAVASPQQVPINGIPAGQDTEGFPCSVSLPGGPLPPTTTECLAFPLNVANVGTGKFELISNTASLDIVNQVTYDTTGKSSQQVAPGATMITPGGTGGFHASLVEMRLRGPIVTGCMLVPPTAGCCDTEATASTCSPVASAPKSICLDTGVQFDQQIYQIYGGSVRGILGPLNCQTVGATTAKPTDSIDMGLQPGTSEFYPWETLSITWILRTSVLAPTGWRRRSILLIRTAFAVT